MTRANRYLLGFLAGACLALFSAGHGTTAARAEADQEEDLGPNSPGVHRFTGPVQLSLTDLVIAPGKDSGLPWDGPGSLPEEVSKLVQTPLPAKVMARVFDALRLGNDPLFLLQAMGIAITGLSAGSAAPDIEATMFFNGRQIAVYPMVPNSCHPTWAGRFTEPVLIGQYDTVDIKVIDRDALRNDEVGMCSLQGQPYVDKRGFVIAKEFRCRGQVWGAGLRLRPVGVVDSADGAALSALAKVRETRNVMHAVENAIVEYQVEHPGQVCPPTMSDLVASKILNRYPTDGWGRPLADSCPGSHGLVIDLSSSGPDGRHGTSDDIRNWDGESH